MRDLQYYGKLVEDELAVIGLVSPKPIRYEASNRLTRAWGNCTTYRNKPYTLIKVATWMLADDIPEKQLRQLLAHEICHSVDENKSGHKGRWLEFAELVSDCYDMDIQQYVTNEEREAVKCTQGYQDMLEKRRNRQNNVSWEFMCDNFGCEKYGHAWKYKRMPKWMNHGFNSNSMTVRGVRCPFCKGKLTITRWTDKLNVLPMYFD